MRIVFDLTPIYDHLTGIERYNINITKEIIKAHPEKEYVLLFKNEVHNSFKEEVRQTNVKYILIPECNKFVFIQWRLYSTLKRIKADFYIFLSFTSPVLFKKQKIINTIHDLTCWDCPESIPTKMKYYYRCTYKVAARRSWKLVTVSRFSQRRICERYGLSKDKVPVIYDGLTDIFQFHDQNNPNLKEKYGLPQKYILSLSTIEPRKNLQLLIKAYREMCEKDVNMPDLVLVGRQGWKIEKVAGDISEDISKKIHFTGFVEDADLPQIYREAELFVFPSKYEGFGLPIIEAMSQGVIVVSSNAASLPEVAEDAGILFESDNVLDLEEKISNALALTKDEKSKLIRKGESISHSFSWQIEAEKLCQLL